MTQRHLYWYCPAVPGTAKAPSTSAILLSPKAVNDWDDESFSAFLLDNRSMTPVQCRRYTASEVATGQNEHGNPVTFFDGEAFRSDLAAEAISAAQNQTLLYLDGVALPVAGPALLSTDESMAYIRHPVVVDLLCTTIAELPDFAANLACSRMFEDLIRGDWPQPPRTFSDELQAYGQDARLGPGFVLPVSDLTGDGDSCGAVVLDTQLAASPLRCSGHLYRFHRTGGLGAGTVLSRRVTWGKGSNQQTRACPVARIVSLADEQTGKQRGRSSFEID